MQRLLTAIALLAFAFYLIFFAPPVLFVVAAIGFASVCYWEYSGLVAAHGIARPGIFGFAAGLLIILQAPIAIAISTTVLVIVALTWSLRQDDLRSVLPQVACAFLGAFYAMAPWRFATDLRTVSVHFLFFALALSWVGDTAAYYVGRATGRHKLAPTVSPKKTWEGAAGSVVMCVIFGLLYLKHFLPQLPWWEVLVMSVVGNIAGQFGDLAESAIKRGAGVKDSSNLLPGHGGMLDRTDSTLFTLPVIYAIYAAVQRLPSAL